MARQRLAKIVSPVGIARYAYLTTPDEYKGKVEYKTKLILDPAEPAAAEYIAKITEAAEKAFEEGLAELKEKLAEAKGKSLKTLKDSIDALKLHLPFEPEYADDGSETGLVVVSYKAAASGVIKHGPKEGKAWKRDLPIFDSQKNKLDSSTLNLWGGSKIRIQAEILPYCAPAMEIAGVSLRLYSVQVIELQGGGGGDADGFGVEEDGFVGDQSAPAADTQEAEGDTEEHEDDDF